MSHPQLPSTQPSAPRPTFSREALIARLKALTPAQMQQMQADNRNRAAMQSPVALGHPL
jgi:hypothetical protein